MKQMRQFFASRMSFKKPVPLLVAAVFVATSAFFIARAVNPPKEGVTLSNGKNVRVGQTLADVKTRLGPSLAMTNSTTYRYPAGKRTEVLLHIDSGLVGAITVLYGTTQQISTGNKISSKLAEIKTAAGSNVGGLGERFTGLGQTGASWKFYQTTGYYFLDPCKRLPGVAYFALIKPGLEHQVAELFEIPNCQFGD